MFTIVKVIFLTQKQYIICNKHQTKGIMIIQNAVQIKKLKKNKKIFFASDLHLPMHRSGQLTDRQQEEAIIAWMDYIMPQAQALFLAGDIFDFWFEYKYLIPKGALKFHSKLQAFDQAKIPIYFLTGNHDYWLIDYATQIANIHIFKNPITIHIEQKRFLIGHGDTINPTIGYRLLRKFYTSKTIQSIARILPADWLYGIIDAYLKKRKKKLMQRYSLLPKKDRIFHYCKTNIEPFSHYDFYIFGHTHTPYIKKLGDSSAYCNLGDWINHYTYAYFDGVKLMLSNFKTK